MQDRGKFAGQRPTFYHFATQPTIICHLTLVMFLRYLTLYKNWNATLTSESIDTWDRIPQGIIDKATDQWQTRLRACVKAKWRHFEHLLWSRHTTGSFQSHWHYWQEDYISFRFFCFSAMSGSVEIWKDCTIWTPTKNYEIGQNRLKLAE